MRSVLVAALAVSALGCQTDTFSSGDAGGDAAGDASDASDRNDASFDAASCPYVAFDGGDKCGASTCAGTNNTCCVGSGQPTCGTAASCVGANDFTVTCHGQAECTSISADAGVAQVCCLSFTNETLGCPVLAAGPGSAKCVALTSCDGAKQRLCHADIDCALQAHCVRVELDGNPVAVIGVCL